MPRTKSVPQRYEPVDTRHPRMPSLESEKVVSVRFPSFIYVISVAGGGPPSEAFYQFQDAMAKFRFIAIELGQPVEEIIMQARWRAGPYILSRLPCV